MRQRERDSEGERVKSSSKYYPGRLQIVGFDYLGAKLFISRSETDNYVKTIAQGRKMVEDGECDTFCVVRVLYNSAAVSSPHSVE
jgi:hypothetical protein